MAAGTLYRHIFESEIAVTPVLDDDGGRITVSVHIRGRKVAAQAWLARVGRTKLYLLDTDLPQNTADDQLVTGHLYGGDTETRIVQEKVLGIGGVRLLRKLGLDPDVYHLNEGHAAFSTLELANEYLAVRPDRYFCRRSRCGAGVAAAGGALCRRGLGLVFISSEMPEILRVSHRIVVLRTARSVVRWEGDKVDHHLDRLRRIAREAAMQSRRVWLPEVLGVQTLADHPGAVLADPGGRPPSTADHVVLCGPAGGWSDEERAANPDPVGLGPGVLRAETAAVTAGALLVALRQGVVKPA